MTTTSTTSKQTETRVARAAAARNSRRRRALTGLCSLLAVALSLAPLSAEAGGRRHDRGQHHGRHAAHHSHHARHYGHGRDHGNHRGHHHYYGHHDHGDAAPWLALAAVSIAIIDAVGDDQDRDGCSRCDESRGDHRDH